MDIMIFALNLCLIVFGLGGVKYFVQSRHRIILRDKALEALSHRQHALLKEKETILKMRPGETQLVMTRLWHSKLQRYFSDLDELSNASKLSSLQLSPDTKAEILPFPSRQTNT